MKIIEPDPRRYLSLLKRGPGVIKNIMGEANKGLFLF